MPTRAKSLVHCVNFTTARNLSPLFDEVVRQQRPVMIVRGGRESAVLISREALSRLLSSYQIHIDTLPEDEHGVTLWARELSVAGTGPTSAAARADLVSSLNAHILDYWQHFDFYRHLPELAAQEPYVLRLSLSQGEDELDELLFGSAVPLAEVASGNGSE